MTLPITETVKDVRKSEGTTRAQFIANRKEVLIKKWWDEFQAEDGKTFEKLHDQWALDASYGILSQPYVIPAVEDCEEALNDSACTFERFSNYFLENLKLY